MTDLDPSTWSGEHGSSADSIAGQVARRIDATPAAPADAMAWATLAADAEQEAAARGRVPEAAALLAEAARIHEERLDAPAQALALLRRAVAADPTFRPALRAGRRLARALGEPELLVELLEAEEAVTPAPRDRAELALARSRALAAAGRGDASAAALAQAAGIDPEQFAVAEEQALRAAAAGDRSGLAEAWLRCAATVGDPHLSADFLTAAAGQLEDALGDPERAGAAALQAFELHRTDPVVRAAARRHAERLGRLDLLAEILRHDAERASPAEAAMAWLDLARVLGELDRPGEAIAALEQGRTAAPSDPLLLGELARRREDREEWAEASAALGQLAGAHLDRSDPAHLREALDAWLRRAEIEEERLGHTDEAVTCYRAVLAMEPGHRPALASLGRLCARCGDWSGLLDAFLAEAVATREPRGRAQRTFKAAEVLEERLQEPERAAELYREALAIDPGLLAARGALQRLHLLRGRWPELLALLETDLAELSAAPAQAMRDLELTLQQRRAELLEEHLDDPAGARAAWEAVRALEPSHLPALRALGRLHVREGHWDALIGLFRAEADASADPDAAAGHVLRIAEILDRRLQRTDEAVAAYREVLTLAPSDPTALGALARLARLRGDFESLVELLRAQAAARAVPSERAALLTEVGRIWEGRLRDPAHAAESYEEALRAAPGFTPAARALDRVYGALGRWSDLAELRRAQVALAGDQAPVLLGLARLALDREGDPAAARRLAGEATAAAPGHPAPLLFDLRLDAAAPERRAALRAALADAAAPGAAAALLAAAADDAGRIGGVAALLDRALAAAPGSAALAPEQDARRAAGPRPEAARHAQARAEEAITPLERASWLTVAGERWSEAGDEVAARAAVEAALLAAPELLTALRAARAQAMGRADLPAARELARREAALRREPHGAAALRLEAGRLGEQLGDPEGAARDYRAAAELDPVDATALARLERLLDGASAGEILAAREARARAERDPARAAEAWLALARAALASPDGTPLARSALDHALAARPTATAALELRGRLRAEAGEAADALQDYELALSSGGEPAARVPLHLAAAGLCAERLGVVARARSHLEAALSLQPDSAEALARLARLDEAEERPSAAIVTLRRLLALPGLPPAEAASHHVALGRLEARTGDATTALAHAARALEFVPGHAEALRLMVELERKRADPRALAAALEGAAAAATEPAFRAELRVEAARLQAGPLKHRTRAIEQLRAALQDDPGRDDARELLAQAYEESAPSLAVEEHRHLLGGEPLRVESWAALYRLFERLRAHDKAYVAATVLRWLGAPSPDPAAERLLQDGDRQALVPPPPLSPEDFALLRPVADQGPLSDLVAISGDAMADALRGGPLAPGEPSRADHPFRRLLAELGRACGVAEGWELYPAPPGTLRVEPGEHPAVLCGTDLPRRTTPREQRFLLGRTAARLRTRSSLAEVPDDARLGEAVAAAVRLVVLGWAGTGRPGDELVKAVGRALTRRARKALEPVARALAAAPPPDLARWRRAAAASADRAGLVLCGDVPTAVSWLVRGGSGAPPADGPELLAAVWDHPPALELLAFAASEAHFVLRQKARVAIA